MGVSKRTVKPGNGSDRPKSGDTVTMSYTGYLFDKNRPGGRGKQFDSSNGRGDFSTKLGGGKVIKGWEVGVLYADGGMTLGEKATLTIPWECGYGENGFPGLIPPKSDLVFDVELKAINEKKA